MNLIVSFLPVLGVLTMLFGMGAGLAYLNRKEKFEANRKALDAIDDTWRALAGRMDVLQDSVWRLAKIPRTGASNTRVYAVYLSRGAETRLTAVPAKSFEEMVVLVAKEFGTGWLIVSTCYVDFLLSVEKKDEPEVAPVRNVEAISKPTPSTFIQSLSYCRDAFAETPFERRALMSVINRIKKKYVNDTPAT